MAVLSVQELAPGGGEPTFAAAGAAGDEAPAGDGHFVWVRNNSAGSIDLTINVPVAQNAVVQYVPAIAAGAQALVPIPQRNVHSHLSKTVERNTNVADRAHWTYSSETSVEVAVVKAP